MDQTTMDDIAAAAQYSKSTLYVYFKSKEEIFQYLVYEFNVSVRDMLADAIRSCTCIEDTFMSFCNTTARMQLQSPFYFVTAMNDLKMGEAERRESPALQMTIDVHAEIHEYVCRFIQKGIASGELRADIEPRTTAYTLWSCIYGIISMTYRKTDYLQRFYRLETDEYLQKAFKTVYKSIQAN